MPSRECRDSTVSATVLAVLLIVTSLSPLALAEETEDDETHSFVGDLSEFNPDAEGRQYLFSESPIPIYSATGFLKSQWRSAGYPDLSLPFMSLGTANNALPPCAHVQCRWQGSGIPTLPQWLPTTRTN